MPGEPTCCDEEVQAVRNVKDYSNMITKDECTCGMELPTHHSAIHMTDVRPPSFGWPVEGHEQRQRLYIVCPQCGYQWDLWQLGVPR